MDALKQEGVVGVNLIEKANYYLAELLMKIKLFLSKNEDANIKELLNTIEPFLMSSDGVDVTIKTDKATIHFKGNPEIMVLGNQTVLGDQVGVQNNFRR